MSYQNSLSAAPCNYAPHRRVSSCAYAAASTPRSGPALFALLCQQAGRLGFPLEYFDSQNEAMLRERTRQTGDDPAIYVSKLLSLRPSQSSGSGTKLHFGDLPHFVEMQSPVLSLGKDKPVILLVRRGEVAQAVSFALATQTGRWLGLPGFPIPIERQAEYDAELIYRALHSFRSDNAKWRIYLALKQCRVLELSYETLVDDCAGTFEKIAGFLDVDLLPPQLGKVELPRQETSVNQIWQQRYLEEA